MPEGWSPVARHEDLLDARQKAALLAEHDGSLLPHCLGPLASDPSDMHLSLGRIKGIIACGVGGESRISKLAVEMGRVRRRLVRSKTEPVPMGAIAMASTTRPSPCGTSGAPTVLATLACLPQLGLASRPLEPLLRLLLNRIGKEVRELLQKVGVLGEQLRHPIQHFFDAALLLLIGVKDLEERLVRFRLIAEPSLHGGHVVNRMVELHGVPRADGRVLLAHGSTGAGLAGLAHGFLAQTGLRLDEGGAGHPGLVFGRRALRGPFQCLVGPSGPRLERTRVRLAGCSIRLGNGRRQLGELLFLRSAFVVVLGADHHGPAAAGMPHGHPLRPPLIAAFR
mmetsp:Transcript_11203/g.41818  ORF Transcript_11203/g.41818 Transcript_11203/m.41818 type:complete len:338 (-) Transcript_11203:760-1773(-)